MLANVRRITVLLSLLLFFSIPGIVFAGTLPPELVDQSAAFAGKQGANFTIDSDPRLVIVGVVQILLSLLGTVFLVYGFWGGYQIFISRGNEEQIKKAKGTILTATIGIFLIVMSYSLTRFVTRSLESAVIQDNFGNQPILNDQNFNINPDPLAP